MKINIFIDMDGVLAIYDKDTVNKMYNENFFINRPPQKGNINLAKTLIADSNFNVFILSSLISGSKFVLKEKNDWLDKYLPELPVENRLFVPEGITKSEFINNKFKRIKNDKNILIDDYTVNLIKWKDEGFIALKMINSLNNTTGVWLENNPNSYLHYRNNPKNNYKKITKLITELN